MIDPLKAQLLTCVDPVDTVRVPLAEEQGWTPSACHTDPTWMDTECVPYQKNLHGHYVCVPWSLNPVDTVCVCHRV